VEIEATYLVPPGSPLMAIAEVDRPGIRIAVPDRSAFELYLTRSLQHTQLVRVHGADNAFQRFVTDQLDAGTPKGRPAGAQYLGAFIEDIKATGLVARMIAKHNVRGLTVAPPA